MKMTKNGKYLKTIIFCHSPVLSCNEGHIFKNIYSKIKTGFYFAISSLTLHAFTILYFSYL